MIKGLYETHIPVSNLERSCEFYSNVLGLKQALFESKRRVAFYWIGKPQQAMLGLWEKPLAEIDHRHFAFQCDTEWILHESIPFLKKHGIKFWNFLKDDQECPMVFAWMPAVSIYFGDPDGHELEFISVIPGTPRPELGVVTYPQWQTISEQD
jgi:catechol 2,3-dioxygenase-like lactoylglutathione lyase family enzyme